LVFLLDASAVSAMMREPRVLDAKGQSLPPEDRIVVCTIVRGEVLFGIKRLAEGRRREELGDKATEVFARLPCEPVPAAAGDHYAALKLARQRAGLSLDEKTSGSRRPASP
jgi:predicted nucleic acid-binding protein